MAVQRHVLSEEVVVLKQLLGPPPGQHVDNLTSCRPLFTLVGVLEERAAATTTLKDLMNIKNDVDEILKRVIRDAFIGTNTPFNKRIDWEIRLAKKWGVDYGQSLW